MLKKSNICQFLEQRDYNTRNWTFPKTVWVSWLSTTPVPSRRIFALYGPLEA